MEQYENGVATDNGSGRSAREKPAESPEARGQMSDPVAVSTTPSGPSSLAGSSISASTSDAGGFFKSVASSLGRNSLPLAMIAGGVGYFVYNELQSRKSSRHTSLSERIDASFKDEAASSARGAVSRVRELAHDVGEGVGAAAGRVGHAARELSDNASNLSSQAAEVARKGQDMLLDRPLVLAGLGLALGAAIAGTAPLSRREQDLMAGPAGDAIDQLVHGAQNLKERAKDSAGAIGKTVKKEASVLMSSTEQVGGEADPYGAQSEDSQSDRDDDRGLT